MSQRSEQGWASQGQQLLPLCPSGIQKLDTKLGNCCCYLGSGKCEEPSSRLHQNSSEEAAGMHNDPLQTDIQASALPRRQAACQLPTRIAWSPGSMNAFRGRSEKQIKEDCLCSECRIGTVMLDTEVAGGSSNGSGHTSFLLFLFRPRLPGSSSNAHRPNPYCKFPTKLVFSSTTWAVQRGTGHSYPVTNRHREHLISVRPCLTILIAKLQAMAL